MFVTVTSYILLIFIVAWTNYLLLFMLFGKLSDMHTNTWKSTTCTAEQQKAT